jgi:hypothetical protein
MDINMGYTTRIIDIFLIHSPWFMSDIINKMKSGTSRLSISFIHILMSLKNNMEQIMENRYVNFDLGADKKVLIIPKISKLFTKLIGSERKITNVLTADPPNNLSVSP